MLKAFLCTSCLACFSTFLLAADPRTVNGISLVKAARTLQSQPYIVYLVIKRLEARGDVSGVPVLIVFLQDDGFGGRGANPDWFVPAVQSRAALFKLTNHWFPLDVVRSREAWAMAKEIPDPQERAAYLARTIAEDPQPLRATVVFVNHFGFVEITNSSKKPVTLTKKPTALDLSYSTGSSSGHMGRANKGDPEPSKDDFVFLKPGASHRFALPADYENSLKGLTAEDKRSLRLSYMSNGNKVGVNAWMGLISVKIPDLVTAPQKPTP